MSSSTALVRTRNLEGGARGSMSTDPRQTDAQIAQVSHPLDLVIAQLEGPILGLHRLGEQPLLVQHRREIGAGYRLHVAEVQLLGGPQHRFGQRAGGGEIALAPLHRTPTEPAAENGDHVPRGLAGFLRGCVTRVGGRPPGLEPAEPCGEQGHRRELSGRNGLPVAPGGQGEDVQRLGQAGFMFQEIGVGREAEAEPCGGLPRGWDGLEDPDQMRGLGELGRQVREVSPHRIHLPGERLSTLLVGGPLVQAVHQSGRHIRSERKPRGDLAVVIAFDPGALQKRGVPQHVSRRPDLVEELLGGEQTLSFQVGGPG
jgi:hypothetical protein